MAEDPWVEGRQAWSRLSEWIQCDGCGAHPHDSDGALRALGDVGLVRRLLDQAEFAAVWTARRHGRSWSEIAVRLGVTRQSAWERWRDVPDWVPGVESAAAELSIEARERRRARPVIVPSLIGKSCADAQELLRVNQFVGVDPDGVPLSVLGRPQGVVVDQNPEAGAVARPGSSVTLWLTRGGGGSGVREPRRPGPDSSSGAKMRDEITDETV